MVGVDFISLPEPAIFARGGGGMFYNQVRWLEIRAILSNLVPTKPGQAQSRLPSFLFLSLSSFEAHQAYLTHGHVLSLRNGEVAQDPQSPVYAIVSPPAGPCKSGDS